MKNSKTILLILILFFTLSYPFAQNKSILNYKIDSLLKTEIPRPFNGVVLITKNGKVKYAKAFGFENYKTKVPLKMEDEFEIMSNTKQITAVLLLKEVEKGHVNLQSSIKQYLPFLPENWADSVTVHQLLNHTHGIIDTKKPLAFKAGTEFKYGNLSNILLGQIIENVSHNTYRELADSLFKSIGMKNTFCFSQNNRRNLVYGHINKDNVFKVVDSSGINDYNLPADGVITTAKDLTIWNSKLHKGKILKPATYKLMITSSTSSQHNVFGKEKMGYGYSIRIVEENGIIYFGHTGLGDGFASLNIYIPESDVSLIILENQMSENSDLYFYFEIEIKKILLKSYLVK